MRKGIISLCITLAAMAANVNGQTMVTGGTDTVSVGSQMPYAVTPDANIQAMADSGWLGNSEYDWQIVSGSGTIDPGQKTGTGVNLYPDSILIEWTGTGNAQISVAENSVNVGSTSILCSDASPENLNVVVVPLPTLDATVNITDCGVTDTVSVDLTGIGPWTIKYEYDHTPIGGSTTTYNNSGNYYVATVGNSNSTAGTYDLPLDFSAASNESGNYIVTIRELDDRISEKSIPDLNGTITSGIQIIAAPIPETGAIRHINN